MTPERLSKVLRMDPWIRWITTDPNRKVYGYAEKPYIDEGFGMWWPHEDGISTRIDDCNISPCENWRDSLKEVKP